MVNSLIYRSNLDREVSCLLFNSPQIFVSSYRCRLSVGFSIRRLEHVLTACALKVETIKDYQGVTDAENEKPGQGAYWRRSAIKTNRLMMHIFADERNIDARLAVSLSHGKIYTLNVIVCDFVGDPDLIFVPVAAWLRENQPDICTLDEGYKMGYRFQMGLYDRDYVDISISMQLTERTIVRNENGALHVSYVPEPPLPELVSKWDE